MVIYPITALTCYGGLRIIFLWNNIKGKRLKMKILLTKCPSCNQEIYSRTNHDCKYCECGDTMVDGGYSDDDDVFKPFRVGAKDLDKISQRVVEIDVTELQLYKDWNNSHDNYGVYNE